jgi:hypothetical protein
MLYLKLAITAAAVALVNFGFLGKLPSAEARLVNADTQEECEGQGGTWQNGKCHI